MRRLALLCAGAALTTMTFTLANEATEEALSVDSKVTAVTVYADRARVTRVAQVTAGAAQRQVAFRKLPGWIDEGSVRVSVTGAELVDVQVRKTFLVRPEDVELSKAQAAVQEVTDQIAALDDEARVLDAQQRQVDSIRAFALDKFPKDVAAREIKAEEYGGVVKFIGVTLLDIAKAKRELDKKRRELQPELNVRQRALNELRQRAQLEQRTVLVSLTGAARGATLALTYMLPGATWEPVHELRTGNGAKEVTLASYGVISQTTGEDWAGVALSLSTQRSTDTIRIPELDKLLVGGTRPLPAMAVAHDTFGVANKTFSGQIMLWNSVNNGGAMQQAEFAQNYSDQQVAQDRNVIRFTQLQEQRGTTAHFVGVGAQTVRTDGRSVRVPIGTSQLVATPKIIAAPEVSLNAARTADLVNAGKQPLLPGKVLLYLDGAFVGTTETEFVASGEGFPMFLGVADQIKLSRALDKKRSSLSWSGKRRRMQVSYLITVENLGEREVVVQLGDRVPVSESDDARVLNVKLTPGTKPDTQGLVKWEAKFAPKQTQEFRVEYLLDYPADLPARMKAAAGEAGIAADNLGEQIRRLESKF